MHFYEANLWKKLDHYVAYRNISGVLSIVALLVIHRYHEESGEEEVIIDA